MKKFFKENSNKNIECIDKKMKNDFLKNPPRKKSQKFYLNFKQFISII